jgi:hypothetical protein
MVFVLQRICQLTQLQAPPSLAPLNVPAIKLFNGPQHPSISAVALSVKVTQLCNNYD